MNYLEQFIAEWLEYSGYFIRRNVRVGKRKAGGYECELDIVGFNPETKHLIHFEPSTDTDAWSIRERRYKKKFDAGKKYIPSLFRGFELPSKIDQQAIFIFGGKTREFIGGGKVNHIKDILKEIQKVLKDTSITKSMVPEQFQNLRTFQLIMQFKRHIFQEEQY